MPNSPLLLHDLAITFVRVGGWTLLSWILGLCIAYLCFKIKPLSIVLLPVVNFMRHISPFCWLPLIILMVGIGEIAVGITLLISLVFHAVIISLEQLHSLPKTVLEQAKLDGAIGWNLFTHIELPLCIIGFIDIFRVLWGVGWSAVIAAEMLGVSSGMGYRLLDFRYLLRYREMLTYIGVIGIVGITLDYLLKSIKWSIEKRLGL
ncbi:MAG: ABC transporter permease subunit [Candidatus Cloacimonetes bacterium]|nr:ABC transporter permease subunit [Candidatus Cloacimonadota bacterium]